MASHRPSGLAAEERPPRRFEAFWRLNRTELANELRKAAPRELSPLVEAHLLAGYADLLEEGRRLTAEIVRLEREVHQQVFDAYRLTPEEIALVRATAPPRDPLALVEGEADRLAGLSDKLVGTP